MSFYPVYIHTVHSHNAFLFWIQYWEIVDKKIYKIDFIEESERNDYGE